MKVIHWFILIGTFLCLSSLGFAQTVPFDQINSNVGDSKAISWTTSSWGSGFGHRIINADPGEFTTLNFQARHNSASWINTMIITSTGYVGIGVTNPTNKLEVNGTIKTKEVNVTTAGWADYVFKPGYNLIPLSEVESFIAENGHLPNVPSEKEVLENGVNLLEMNVKLLEKVEELTLYVIELEKMIKGKTSN